MGNYRTIVSEKMLHFHLRSLEDCERFPSSRQFWTLVGLQLILLAMCVDDVGVSGFEIRKSCLVLPTSGGRDVSKIIQMMYVTATDKDTITC